MVTWDICYLSEFVIISILRWDDVVTSRIKQDISSTLIPDNLYKPILKYVEQIEAKYEGYLN